MSSKMWNRVRRNTNKLCFHVNNWNAAWNDGKAASLRPLFAFLLRFASSANPSGSLRLARYPKCYRPSALLAGNAPPRKLVGKALLFAWRPSQMHRLRKCPSGTATGWLFRRLFFACIGSAGLALPPPLVGPCARRTLRALAPRPSLREAIDPEKPPCSLRRGFSESCFSGIAFLILE